MSSFGGFPDDKFAKPPQHRKKVNMKVIEGVSIREFNGPSKVYCFRQDRFLDYMKTLPPEPEKKLEL